MKKRNGFTLTELVLIVGVLLIVGAIVYFVVNPTQKLAQSRDSRRASEVNSILDSVIHYSTDNNGKFPAAIDDNTDTSQIIGSDKTGCDTVCPAAGETEAVCVDLSSDLVPKYIGAIPQDPQKGTPGRTMYYINKTANGRILVGACDTELSPAISTQN